MTALIHDEKRLQFLVDLAERRIPKKQLYSRMAECGISKDEALRKIEGVTHPFPVWLLDSSEAAKMLLKQYHLRKQNNLSVPPMIDAFVTDAIGRILDDIDAEQALWLRRPTKRPKDRRKGLETETLRELIQLEMQYIRADPLLDANRKGAAYLTALERIADSHGMSPSSLDKRLHPRDKKKKGRARRTSAKNKNGG